MGLVPGPAPANNGAVVGSLVPFLALGIPFSPTAAVMLAGLRMHNVEAGPMLFRNAPEVFWGLVAAMYVGNLMLLVLNLPLVGLFARIATIRPQVLLPAGVAGFWFRRWGFPVAPLAIGMVLGPMTENNLRLTMQLLDGDLTRIAWRPLAMAFLLAAVAFQVFVRRRARTTLAVAAEEKA